jgi:hypothetical protein
MAGATERRWSRPRQYCGHPDCATPEANVLTLYPLKVGGKVIDVCPECWHREFEAGEPKPSKDAVQQTDLFG